MIKWLKEPLFHFLVIGIGVFFLYEVTSTNKPQDEVKLIEVNKARANRMVTLWEKRWNRLPSKEEFNALVEQYINEEVLYREALAMGLDNNDPVVRRRMAQKVKFISNDIITIETPSEKVLQNYLDTHASRYQLEGSMSFQHIYFNPSKHDSAMESEAKILLSKLLEKSNSINMKSLGDSFLHGTNFTDIKVFEINRLFGKDFTKELFEKPVGKWLGPLVSGYGLHLVKIDLKIPTKTASLKIAKSSVLEDWINDERKKFNNIFLSNLRKQYNIKISKPKSEFLSTETTK